MTKGEILTLQRTVGTVPDRVWGSKSTRAAQEHLRSLMPSPNPWPKSDRASLREFFGEPGDESHLVNMPVPDGVIVKYEGQCVKTIRCHKKVAASLSRVLQRIDIVAPDILLEYAGCFNNRSVRGGSTPSLHAYGAAIDFMPDTNGNHTHWPTGADMPLIVMEEFAKEGWLPAGAFWSRDAMHFQATR